MCCSVVPISRFALSVRSVPHFLSTTSLLYTSTSPTGCPVKAPFTIVTQRTLLPQLSCSHRQMGVSPGPPGATKEVSKMKNMLCSYVLILFNNFKLKLKDGGSREGVVERAACRRARRTPGWMADKPPDPH
eukprot:1141829-Pelagomonas_calceolata.AAC.1